MRASHAKPWKVCSDEERVDPYNGLLLEARLDALFDRGLISFTDGGDLLISPCLSAEDRTRLHLTADLRLRKSPEKRHLPYLHWHREEVFRADR